MGGNIDHRITDSLLERLRVTDTNAVASCFPDVALAVAACVALGAMEEVIFVTHPSPRLGQGTAYVTALKLRL